MIHALILLLLALPMPADAARPPVAIDGDTARIGGRMIRLAGIDAPELRRPRCPAERERARQARDRLTELMTAGPVKIQKLRRRDRYGRLIAILRDEAGRDLGQVLVSEGLAVPYQGRGRRMDWCTQ